MCSLCNFRVLLSTLQPRFDKNLFNNKILSPKRHFCRELIWACGCVMGMLHVLFFCFRMPNKYIRKTDRGMASDEIYELAFEEVTIRGQSLRNAAFSYNLNYMSLSRYIKKKQAFQDNETDVAPSMGYAHPTVFTDDEENILCEYLLTCAASNWADNKRDKKDCLYCIYL